MLIRDMNGDVYEIAKTGSGIKLLLFFGNRNQQLKNFSGEAKKNCAIDEMTIPMIGVCMRYCVKGEEGQKKTYPVVEIVNKNKFKKFEFKIPSFEEWNIKGRKFKQTIGDYTCAISTFSQGVNGNVIDIYKASIADYEYPNNIYVKKIVSKSLECHRDDLEKIKEWYNSVKDELNNAWEKFIIDNNFE